MHKDEEGNDDGVIVGMPPAIIIGVVSPPSLSQDLHHQILRVQEGIEVRELNLIAVASPISNCVVLGVIKDFHADDSEDIEDEGEKKEELADHGHYQ